MAKIKYVGDANVKVMIYGVMLVKDKFVEVPGLKITEELLNNKDLVIDEAEKIIPISKPVEKKPPKVGGGARIGGMRIREKKEPKNEGGE